ncbi:MAG: hypothetical protein K2X77_32635, partial [Candidatus Obscuribacterales bacterium]|nr:hypothetical protein [Candidatus Obscuribacterales bacterium]
MPRPDSERDEASQKTNANDDSQLDSALYFLRLIEATSPFDQKNAVRDREPSEAGRMPALPGSGRMPTISGSDRVPAISGSDRVPTISGSD